MSNSRNVIPSARAEDLGIEPLTFEVIPDSGDIPMLVPFLEEPSPRRPIIPDSPQDGVGQMDEENPDAETPSYGPGLSPEQMEELYARLRREDAEIERTVQSAYEKGVADGERRREEAETQLAERYAYGLEKLHMLGKSLETLARHEALEIALMVAKRIIQVEIEMRPMVLVEQVKRVARELMGKKELTIHVNPADLAQIRNLAPDFSEVFPAVAQIALVGDDELERGDCVIETEVEQINMTLAEQLSAIKRALDEEIR